MQIASKITASILSSYFQYYFENFDKDSFKMGMGTSSTVHMEDIVINNEFLKSAVVLPNLKITKCACSYVDVTVPWTSLSSQPIVLSMGECWLHLEEVGSGAEKEEEDRKLMEKRKKKKKPSSYGFVGRCFDGIRLNVEHLNFSLRVHGYRNNPGVLNCRFDKLQVFSSDSSWMPVDLKASFSRDNKLKVMEFFKVVTVRRIDVGFLEEPDKYARVLEEAVILRQCPVEIRARIKKDVSTATVLCATLDMLVRDFEASFTDHSWKAFFELLKGVMACMTRTDLQYGLTATLEREQQMEEEEQKKGGKKKKDKKKDKKAALAAAADETADSSEIEDILNEVPDDLQDDPSVAELRAKGKFVHEDKERKDKFDVMLGRGAGDADINWEVDPYDVARPVRQTSFNMFVSNGVCNALDPRDKDSQNPADDAFSKFYLHDMRCRLVLPPVDLVEPPEAHKLSRKLCEMSMTLDSCAAVGVERVVTRSKKKDGKDKVKLKQVVLATDVSNTALKQRAELRKERKRVAKDEKREAERREKELKDREGRKLTKAEKRADKEAMLEKNAYFCEEYVHERKDREAKERGEKQRHFVIGHWVINSAASEQQDMEVWLKSLVSRVMGQLFGPQMLVASSWWSRIMRFMEVSSLSTTEVAAVGMMKLCLSGDCHDGIMSVPLQSFEDVVSGLAPIQPIVKTARNMFRASCPLIEIGRHRIGDGVTQMFRSTRPAMPPVEIPTAEELEAEEKRERKYREVTLPDGTTETVELPRAAPLDANALARSVHIRKPQRYQGFIHQCCFEINEQVLVESVDVRCEGVLHRLKGTDQLLLEMYAYVDTITAEVQYEQYFLFHHFMDYVMENMWFATESVLLRKYGPTRIQNRLLTRLPAEVAEDDGMLPVVVLSRSFVDEFVVHLHHDPAKGEMVTTTVIRGMEGFSHNSNFLKTGVYEKSLHMAGFFIGEGRDLSAMEGNAPVRPAPERVAKAVKKARKKAGGDGAGEVKRPIPAWEQRNVGVTVDVLRGQLSQAQYDRLADFSLEHELKVLEPYHEDIVKELRKAQEDGAGAGSLEGIGNMAGKSSTPVLTEDISFSIDGKPVDEIPPLLSMLLNEFTLVKDTSDCY